MRLRKYKKSDSIEIAKWISTEREKALWSADRYPNFPITSEDINNEYNTRLSESKNFYPMTLTEGNKIIGHLLIRALDKKEAIYRFGYIIISPSYRGKEYGKTLVLEAIRYSIENLSAKKITLNVFKENEVAFDCYKSVGFKVVDIGHDVYKFNDEKWTLIEMEFIGGNL